MRLFTIEAHLNLGPKMCITTDASPWGLGAFATIDGKPIGYFAAPIQPQDIEILGLKVVSCDSQQALEALAALVALRTWALFWKHRRVELTIRTDNMTAIALVHNLKGKGGALAIIAREMALDVAGSEHEPDMIQHTPGVMNTTADVLSRKFQPGQVYTTPAALGNATECTPVPRDRAWWRSLPLPLQPRPGKARGRRGRPKGNEWPIP